MEVTVCEFAYYNTERERRCQVSPIIIISRAGTIIQPESTLSFLPLHGYSKGNKVSL